MHISQEVCPWNQRFASEVTVPAFAPREGLGEKDARTLAREHVTWALGGISRSVTHSRASFTAAAVCTGGNTLAHIELTSIALESSTTRWLGRATRDDGADCERTASALDGVIMMQLGLGMVAESPGTAHDETGRKNARELRVSGRSAPYYRCGAPRPKVFCGTAFRHRYQAGSRNGFVGTPPRTCVRGT